MNSLISSACTTLTSTTSSTAMRRVAATTLLSAIEQGIDLPRRAPRQLWEYAKTHDDGGMVTISMTGLGRVLDQQLVNDVVAALSDPESGDTLRDAAGRILSDEYSARHVSDQQILAIVESVRDGDQASRLARLIRWVSRARPVDTDLLLLVRDRLAGSSEGEVRRWAIDVSRELPDFDFEFIEGMLGDPASQVRSAAGDALEVTGKANEERALTIVREALRTEAHPEVMISLYWTLKQLEGAQAEQ